MLYPRIAEELLEMRCVDQEMRCRLTLNQNAWKDGDDDIDSRNTKRVMEIVGQIGWPTNSRVGEEAAHAAWLLVQHADREVTFQSLCLKLMKESPEGEVGKRDIAYLEDRVLVNLGQPQLFGTQFDEVKGKSVLRPIRDPEKVDERRLPMGLGTLREGIEHMIEKYRST